MDSVAEDLSSALTRLVEEASAVSTQIKITSAAERQFYAKSYLWWRQAQTAPKYLETVYAAKGISFNATQNRINWRPLLKLVTDGRITKTDLDIWSRAFAAIHDDFESDPEHYAHDPVGKIDYYIDSKGGKTGVAGYHDKADDLDDDDADESAEIYSLVYELDDDELKPVFEKLAKVYYGSAPSLAAQTASTAHFTEHGFGLALIRSGKPGFEYLSTINMVDLVDTVLVDSYRSDFVAAPTGLRPILETLHILNIPRVLSRSIDKFAEFTKIQGEGLSKTTVRANKQLIYRPNSKDFLLSRAHLLAAACVVARPKKDLFTEAKSDLLLSPYLRQSIEVRLLHQRTFNLFAPCEGDKYTCNDMGGVEDFSLAVAPKQELLDHLQGAGLDQKAIDRISNLNHDTIRFHPLPADHALRTMAEPNVSGFVPTWTATVDIAWLSVAVSSFFDHWIVEYGVKSNRQMNRTMSIGLDSHGVLIGYEFNSDLGFDSSKELPFLTAVAQGTANLVVKSSDFAFMLRQVSDLPISGQINIAASEDVFSLNFETEACSYTVYIPASDDSGTRKRSGLRVYNVVRRAAAAKDKSPSEPEHTLLEENHWED
ncbi:hypothetical protein [Aestuariivirga sp.]|uniref:hypothetical protein n=1 Tax=Aestuariivirga sp. TaxID=2650926 RepID=UPI003BA99BF8